MAKTREIDKLAQNVLNDSLPPGWLIRKQDPDVHIDYFVEIDDNSEPSGLTFGVQLKGTGSPRYSKGFIKVSLKTKHLSYYLDRVRQPVFLVAVDIKKKKGYWIFIQKWEEDELKERHWRDQNKITVKIPLLNSLSDNKRLRESVSKAEIYMRELWPSSIPSAIKHEKKSLESLDNRIMVNISYEGGKTAYQLQAKEPFNVDLQFRSSSKIKNKFDELIERGKSATFSDREFIGFKGSPLLEEIFGKGKKGALVIKPGRQVHASLIISSVDLRQKDKIVIYGVEGHMHSGTKEARFEGHLKESPLKINLALPIPPSLEDNPLEVNIGFDSSEWQGQPMLTLPHFEKLKDFFAFIQEGLYIRIICEIKGNQLFTATSDTKIEQSFMEYTVRHLNLLEKVRIIAGETNINPLYPKNGFITKDDFETILLLYDLIKKGEYRQSGNGVNFRATLLPNDNFFQKVDKSDVENFSGPLIVEPKDQEFSLFGKEFEFGLLQYTLTNPIYLSKKTQDIEQANKESVNAEWAGGIDSELIIKKV